MVDELLSGAELQCAARIRYRDRKKIESQVHVEEFFAVLAPTRLDCSVRRDLPLALSAAKGNHIHLRRAGFGRHVGEPTAIRRKFSRYTPLQDQRWFALSFQRQGPDLPVWTTRYGPRIDQVLAVARPAVECGLIDFCKQSLFRAAAIGGFSAERKLTAASGGVGDPFAVGRPDGENIPDRSEGESGADSACQIEHPDVGLTGVKLESDAVSLRGKNRGLQVGEVAGNGADLLPAAVHPD